MKVITIGSSNVYRFIKEISNETRDLISMQKCTQMSTFKVRMEELEETDERILITVIENFICDTVGEESEKQRIEKKIDESLSEFVEILGVTAKKLPRSRLVVIEPMARPAVQWYTEGLKAITSEYSKRIQALQLINISVVKRCDLPKQIFDQDQVHLTIDSGKQFLESIMYYAGQVYEAQLVELDNEQVPMEVVAGGSGQSETESGIIPLTGPVATMPRTTEQRLDDLEARIETRWKNDDIVIARIREELDFAANTKKEDRIIITGMTSTTESPKSQIEMKKWLKEVVVPAHLNKIVPESGKKILFVSPGRSTNGEIPLCEVRLEDRECALKIRKAYGQMRKEGKVEGRLFVANSVTQATRVRLEVLRAIAKVCSTNNEDFFAQSFTSRPVLQIKRKDSGGQLTLPYVDAVSKFGGRVGDSDLSVAYERAGATFKGQMRQNFIVLADKGVRSWGNQSRGGAGRSTNPGTNKRGRETENEPNQSKRQSWISERGSRGGRGGNAGGQGRGKTGANGN